MFADLGANLKIQQVIACLLLTRPGSASGQEKCGDMLLQKRLKEDVNKLLGDLIDKEGRMSEEELTAEVEKLKQQDVYKGEAKKELQVEATKLRARGKYQEYAEKVQALYEAHDAACGKTKALAWGCCACAVGASNSAEKSFAKAGTDCDDTCADDNRPVVLDDGGVHFYSCVTTEGDVNAWPVGSNPKTRAHVPPHVAFSRARPSLGPWTGGQAQRQAGPEHDD